MTQPWMMHQDDSGGIPPPAPVQPPEALSGGHRVGGLTNGLTEEEDSKAGTEPSSYIIVGEDDYNENAVYETCDTLEEALERLNELADDDECNETPRDYRLFFGTEIKIKKAGYVVDND